MLFIVAPSSTSRPRLSNSQLVCLQPVAILNLVMFIWIFIYNCLFTLVLKSPNGEGPITYTYIHSHTRFYDFIINTVKCRLQFPCYTCTSISTWPRHHHKNMHIQDMFLHFIMNVRNFPTRSTQPYNYNSPTFSQIVLKVHLTPNFFLFSHNESTGYLKHL